MQFRFDRLVSQGLSEKEAYMSLEVDACREREPNARARQINDEIEYSEGLSLNGFRGTRYPCTSTMDFLGITEDVELLAENCGMLQFFATPHDTFEEECIDFLATVCTHYYDQRITGLQERDGGGYITFTVRGEDFRFTFREIETLFGFREGTREAAVVAKAELDAVWRLLTSRPVYSSTNSKGSWIRNPAIRYFRKAVGNTLYARDTTGNVNKSEAEILVIALADVLGNVFGQQLFGDTENSSFGVILAEHLTTYRSRAYGQASSGVRRPTNCGGIASAIMRAAGVTLHELNALGGANNLGYELMDVKYMQDNVMLHKKPKFADLYKFRHPEQDRAYIRLPRPYLTTLRGIHSRRNAEFIPPIDELAVPAHRGPSPPPSPPPSPQHHSDPEPAHQQEPARRRQKAKKPNLANKVQQSLLKAMRKLTGQVSKMQKEIAELKNERRAPEVGSQSSRHHRHSYAGSRQTGDMDISPAQTDENEEDDDSSSEGDSPPPLRRHR